MRNENTTPGFNAYTACPISKQNLPGITKKMLLFILKSKIKDLEFAVEEFHVKTVYINLYQFEIFATEAAEIERKKLETLWCFLS